LLPSLKSLQSAGIVFGLLCIARTATAVTISNPNNQADAWQSSPEGVTLLRSFTNSPYPHASRSSGYTYDGKYFSAADHYSDSTIGIFVPASFRPSAEIHYVVHFHGWSNHVSSVLDHYRLRQQFADSGVNAILLVPQGPKDAADSGGGKLELDNNAFKNLLTEITDFLNEQGKIHTHRIGKIVLSTHSGGYAVTSAILDHGGLTDHITDVLLFDSSYGGLDHFAAWAAGGHGRRLVSIFTAHLAPENYMLITLLQKLHAPFGTRMEPEITAATLAPRESLFFHTQSIEHDEIMQKKSFFSLFLKTSALGAIQSQ
jgi:hypothetical protein